MYIKKKSFQKEIAKKKKNTFFSEKNLNFGNFTNKLNLRKKWVFKIDKKSGYLNTLFFCYLF